MYKKELKFPIAFSQHKNTRHKTVCIQNNMHYLFTACVKAFLGVIFMYLEITSNITTSRFMCP